MVLSKLYTLKGTDWKFEGEASAAPKSPATAHAERILYKSYVNKITASPVSAFVQDAAPCDTCHKFFLDLSVQTPVIVAIGKMGSGKNLGSTGYPALAGTIVIPTHIDENGTEQNAAGFAQFVLKAPQFLDAKSLPVLFFYRRGICYMGGAPEPFPIMSPDLLHQIRQHAN